MRGNGNGFLTLSQKLWFFLLPSAAWRTKYIYKHKKRFRHVGTGCIFQPRKLPADPEYISFGDNVRISSNVTFINHDIANTMLNSANLGKHFEHLEGCIEIGNNVMIGTGVLILPDVKIGNNVIIGAGAIVTKDIPDNSVAAGVPCKVVGSFNDFVEKRSKVKKPKDTSEAWKKFLEKRRR